MERLQGRQNINISLNYVKINIGVFSNIKIIMALLVFYACV